jgi:hypothetical protein
MAANANSVVILRSHMDWDNWIREIRVKAAEHDVWEYIDPENNKPPQLALPEKPDFRAISPSSSGLEERKFHFEMEMREWSEQREAYKAKKAAISSLLGVISQSLAIEHRYLLDEVKLDPRSILIKLQDKLKPSKWESDSKVRSQWQSLLKGWNRRISLDDWLNQWSAVYRQAKRLELYDFPDERVFSDFLLTIESIDPQFPSQIDTMRELGRRESFESTVNRFREKRRRLAEHPAHQGKRQEAFPTFRGQQDSAAKGQNQSSGNGSGSQGGNQGTGKCICGSTRHLVSHCWAVNEDERPEWWTIKPDKQKRVNDAIDRDPQLQKQRDQHRRKGKEASNQAIKPPPEAYFVAPHLGREISAFLAENQEVHPFQKSVILDSGATGHIVNQRDRFVEFTPTPDDVDYTLGGVGAGAPRIQGTGKAWISVLDPEGKKERINLADTAYVPGSPLSMVSVRTLEKKGIIWDMDKHTVRYNRHNGGRDLIKVIPTETHYLLEDNRQPEAMPARGERKSASPQTSQATKEVWHRRMGHPGDELLQYLPNAVNHIVITDQDSKPRSDCEDCKLASAPRQVSRKEMARGNRPWEFIHFDIVPMEPSWDGYHTYFLHFYCPFSHYHEVRCMEGKWETTRQIKAFYQLLYNKGFRPETYHTDGERSLGLDLQDHLKEAGMQLHQTAPYTPDQNGMAERAGGVIVQVARSIRLAARLPADLWPPTVEHAAYLLNRRPVKSLGQKTPYEMVYGLKPDLGNLRIFGCRAYRRIPYIPKLDKLEARSEPGYFVGIQASNIFKIWHPESRKVVPSRDVTFDEKLFFDSNQPIRLVKQAAQLEEASVGGLPTSGAAPIAPPVAAGPVARPGPAPRPPPAVESAPPAPEEDEDIIQRQNRAIFENARRLQAAADRGNDRGNDRGEADQEADQEAGREADNQPPGDEATQEMAVQNASMQNAERNDEAIQMQEGDKMQWEPTFPSPAESSPNQEIRASEPALPEPYSQPQPEPQSYTPPDTPPATQPAPVPAPHRSFTEASPPPPIEPIQRAVALPINRDDLEFDRHEDRAYGRELRNREVSRQRDNYHQAQRRQEDQVIRHDQLRAEQFDGIRQPAPPRPAPRSNEVSADLNPDLILSAPRNRKRKEAYYTALETLPKLPGYFSAFAHGITHKPELWNEEVIWHRTDLPKPPETWAQMNRLPEPHKTGFLQASRLEYDNITRMGTWEEIPRPGGERWRQQQVLPLKWVWSYKFDSEGNLAKYKARICVRGDLQDQGISFSDTYAATLSARVIRCLLALAAVYRYRTNQRDMVNAFLNSSLDHPVCVEFPEGMGDRRSRCLKLHRALYGLKQAPRLWQRELAATLTSMGLQQSSEELCLFQNQYLILFFFVDDVVTLYRPEHEAFYHSFWTELATRYEARDMGQISWFLGMRVLWKQGAVYLCQDSYIEKVASRFHLTTSRSIATPLPAKKLEKSDAQDNQGNKAFIHLYQQKVGSVLYAALITRPDIAFAAVKLSCFMNAPTTDHMEAVDRVIQYLFSTRFLAIRYSHVATKATADTAAIFTAASDAAFADNSDRKSSEGFLFRLYGGPLDWTAKKQRTISTSTTEAELLALSEAAKQLIWWHRLFRDICFEGASATIDCDNRQTVRAMIHDEAIQTRLRHVDIRNHWLRQEYQSGRIHINWIPTDSMPADGLTKALSSDQHGRFIQQLGLVDAEHLIG